VTVDRDQGTEFRTRHDPPANGGTIMPKDVAIIVTIVALAFIAFAGVLYWAEAQTRDLKR